MAVFRRVDAASRSGGLRFGRIGPQIADPVPQGVPHVIDLAHRDMIVEQNEHRPAGLGRLVEMVRLERLVDRGEVFPPAASPRNKGRA
jgi:hypothetical protein